MFIIFQKETKPTHLFGLQVSVLVLEGVQGMRAPTDFRDSNKMHPQNFG